MHSLLIAAVAALGQAQEQPKFLQPPIQVPPGYTVELAAGPPLVAHPVMAGFDERGRLYVAENAGVNLQRPLLEEQLPNSILRLEDTNGDGQFDKRTVFADKLTFPQGALWHDGWLYAAVSGAIWRFQDRDDDGVAETREKIVSSFGYTGNAADVHGCFLGQEGRIYWCEGRHGHDITDSAGKSVSKGKAARIFSCRPDGSDVRTHCGGGMDNPVEVDWTASGEMLGTVNIMFGKRGDCLVHWMHGGVYPRPDQPAVLAEFRRTGDLLPAVHDYGHVAVSGCCRIRGIGVWPVQNVAASFLVTEFNTHKVLRTDLHRDGATFRAEVSEFLQAAGDDFHPTDVLEDADGSFLVVDTGGWFRIGCPTSQVAKPDVLGAIYRVRRADAKIDDPRGLKLSWKEVSADELTKRLGDVRPAIAERAIAALAGQGNAALAALSRAAVQKNPAVRQNALWALARIGTPDAAGAIRLLGLADRDAAVLTVAIQCVGICRDRAAVDELGGLLAATDQPLFVAREAATALGCIGDAAAVPALLAGIRRPGDRMLEHALIYALIEIHDRAETAKGLASGDPRVRRAALIALDQMPDGNLRQAEVAGLLDTADQPLAAAALEVIARRPGWTDELLALATRLLAQPKLSDEEQVLLSGALAGFVKDERVQALIGQSLAGEGFHSQKLSLLLDVVAQSDVRPLPASWTSAIRAALVNVAWDTVHLIQAAQAIAACGEASLDADLIRLAGDRTYSNELRLAAYFAAAQRLTKVEAVDFDFLRSMLQGERPPERRLAAARVLAGAPLSDAQLMALTENLAVAGPLEVRTLLGAFKRTTEVEVGRRLFAALSKSKLAGGTITVSEIAALVEQFPQVRLPQDQVQEWLSSDSGKRNVKLLQQEERLPNGDRQKGRGVFFGHKLSCHVCHRVGSEGGRIGPDLSKVGERRSRLDLLEAIAVPSSSLARGFESQTIRTQDGQVLTGLIIRESPESLFLRTLDQRELRVKRNEIDQQQASTLSIMPAGLDKAVSEQELADLLAYLQSLK